MEGYRKYIVRERIVGTPSVTTLRLAPIEGKRPVFIPGQFVNIIQPDRGSEAKSYSIMSARKDADLAISIRKAGDFSSSLIAREAGELLFLSEPCGYFYPVDETTPRLFIAGGIGAAPFLCIARAAGEAMPRTRMLYSSRAADDIAFKEELEGIAARSPQFTLSYFVTRAPSPTVPAQGGRISSEHLKEALDTIPHCFVCGGIEFVRDMRLQLKSLGVPEDHIFTEAFF